MLILICLAVFVVPMASLVTMPGTIVWWPQYISFIMLGFLLASAFIWRESKALSLLSIYCLYSYVFVCHQHPRALMCLVSAYAGIALICAVGALKETKFVYKAILGIVIAQFVLVVLQRLNLDPFFHLNGNEKLCDTVGFVGSHNQLGIYSASVLPLFLNWFALLALIPLFLSKCSSALLGAVLGVSVVLGFMGKRSLIFLFLAVLVFSSAWLKVDSSAEYALRERIAVWKLSVKQLAAGKAVMKMSEKVNRIVTCNPLTGFGLGSFIMISPSTQEETISQVNKIPVKDIPENFHRYEHAHNDAVEWLFEGGYLGVLILLFCLLSALGAFILSPKTPGVLMIFGSLVAMAVTSMGAYVVHAPVSFFMFCLMVGLFNAEVKDARTII